MCNYSDKNSVFHLLYDAYLILYMLFEKKKLLNTAPIEIVVKTRIIREILNCFMKMFDGSDYEFMKDV